MAVLPAAALPRCPGRWTAAARVARVALAAGLLAAAVSARAAEPPRVEVATGEGAAVVGLLEAIDDAGVRLADSPPGSGAAVVVPLDRVRSVRRTDVGADEAGQSAGRLVVTLVDGSTFDGDDVAWDGNGPVVIVRPEGRVELPAARVRSVAWRADGAAPGWVDAVPEGTESDLVVVGTAAGHEFVECAITAVSADAVTVLLDEEKIPVKRSKVIGLEWLRDAKGVEGRSGPGRVVVELRRGRLHADRVGWSTEGLVVDGGTRLPAEVFVGVDFAAGRRMSLAGLAPDRVDVEPWFGALGRSEGLASFFAPRTVPPAAAAGAGGPPTIVMRPRTSVVWRLPADGRRFRTRIAPAAGPQAAEAATVVVTADDRELFRRRIDAASVAAAVGGDAAAGTGRQAGQPGAGVPVDLDITAARRLVVTVDFVTGGGIGGAVRLIDPVIER